MLLVRVKPRTLARLAKQMYYASLQDPRNPFRIDACSDLSKEDIFFFVNIWHKLNIESQALLYSATIPDTPDLELFEAKDMPLTHYQFLKYLYYLERNIDKSSIQQLRNLAPVENEAIILLTRMKREVSDIIISQLKEFIDADVPFDF